MMAITFSRQNDAGSRARTTKCWEVLVLVVVLVLQSKCLQPQTWTLNFHADPTGTPGIGPKWFGGTIEHTFVRPTQAIPYKTQHDTEREV